MRDAWVEARRRSASLGRVPTAGLVVWVVCGGLILAGLVAWRVGRPVPRLSATEPSSILLGSARQRHPGLLVDRRDDALGRVLAAPTDVEAMDSLVRSQRHLSANNPAALRAKARDYARAARLDAPTTEYYTPQAMRLLVLANLLAATQIETEAGVRPPLRRPASPVAHAPAPPLRGIGHAPRPGSLRPSELVAPQSEYFLVVSTPLTVQQAQLQVSRLASAGFAPLLRRTGDGRVQVQIGAFTTRANAETLAAKARERGLTAVVIRGPAGTAFHPAPPAPPVAAAPRPVVEIPNFDTLMERGLHLYAGGWYGPALASFRLAANTRSGSANAHLWWGRAAFRVSRFQEAREALLRTLELSKDTDAARQARLLLQKIPAGRAITSSSGVE